MRRNEQTPTSSQPTTACSVLFATTSSSRYSREYSWTPSDTVVTSTSIMAVRPST
jgi:hypothetical protein